MTAQFRPITDRSQPAPQPVPGLLSESDYILVEHEHLTWPVMLARTVERLQIHIEHLQTERAALIRVRDDLTTENALLRAENRRLSVINADREQRRREDTAALRTSESARGKAERYGWVWFGLFCVVFVLAMFAASFIRWD